MLTPTVTTGAQAAASTTRTTNKDLGQKDIFLKLLVAQMQNQNPLKPQDATKMSSQLAQFNMVEQQTKSNTLLQQLVDAKGGSGAATPTAMAQSSNGASYLGRTVTVNDNGIYYNGTQQSFSVSLNQGVTSALISITDASGNPVRTISSNNLTAGNNALIWDGKTDAGAIAAQGDYTVQVSATDVNGADVGFNVQRSGQVNAVRFGAKGTELMVGGIAVPIADVTEIRL